MLGWGGELRGGEDGRVWGSCEACKGRDQLILGLMLCDDWS